MGLRGGENGPTGKVHSTFSLCKDIGGIKGSYTIAAERRISPMTVGTHRRNILQRTGMRNTAELMRHASAVGWV